MNNLAAKNRSYGVGESFLEGPDALFDVVEIDVAAISAGVKQRSHRGERAFVEARAAFIGDDGAHLSAIWAEMSAYADTLRPIRLSPVKSLERI